MHSAGAVSSSGDVFTWGCGRSGKLGLGSASDACSPSRVEALVGRGHVTRAAMGEEHSLFLDRRGRVWSCGENKEGQCGVGTSLETIASQHRSAWQSSMSEVFSRGLQQNGKEQQMRNQMAR